MSNYEIMLIIDPKSDEKVASEIAKSTFKSKDVKIEKLERTELAYEINKSKTAIYVLVNVKATGDEINEFTRKANITKTIWRILSINLDSEKGLNRKAKPKKVRRPMSFSNRRSNGEKNNFETSSTTEPSTETSEVETKSKAKRTTKKADSTKEVSAPKKTTKKSTKKEE